MRSKPLSSLGVLLCLGTVLLASCGPSPTPTAAVVVLTPTRTPLPPPISPDFPTGTFFHKHADATYCVYQFNEDGTFVYYWKVLSLNVTGKRPFDRGTYTIDGNRYTETVENLANCPPATYAWTHDGQALAFQVVGEDKCSDRQITLEKPWSKLE